MSLTLRIYLIFTTCVLAIICSMNICFAEFMVCSKDLRLAEFDDSCKPPKRSYYEKDIPRKDPSFINYAIIWEVLVKAKNKLNDDEFNNIIDLYWAYPSWSFFYYVKIDWFYARCHDELRADLSGYKDHICTFNAKQSLAISSATEAVNKLIESVGQDNIFERSKYECKFDRDGDPIMKVFFVIDRKSNNCSDAKINLRTGIVTKRKDACVRN